MSDTIDFSPRGAFSYMWNKGVNSDNPYLIRFGKSMACLFKALFCEYSVEKVEVRACLDGGHHRNSIFFKECHKKLENFKVKLVNESAGETHNNYKEELPKESEQNILFAELENLIKDKNCKISDSLLSMESLDRLKPTDCLRLFCKACEFNSDIITLRLLTVQSSYLSMPLSENEKKNVLSFFLRYAFANKVRFMLEVQNVDVNSPDNKGNIPIMTAAKLGHVECLELLINNGAKVCGSNTLDGSPLFCAALNGHADALKRLLDVGAKIDEPNEKGLTPLHAAAHRGHEVCLNLLLTAGANVNESRLSGITPLDAAAVKCNKECLSTLLVAGADFNKRNNFGMTPLCYVARKGNEECLRMLLEAGANVNGTDSNGFTPLHIIAEIGHEECLKVLLLRPDIQVNLMNDMKMTPLSLALIHGDLRSVETLLGDSKINVNQQSGLTHLHYAVIGGSLECLKSLLRKEGIDVDMTDNNGDTFMDYLNKTNKSDDYKRLCRMALKDHQEKKQKR